MKQASIRCLVLDLDGTTLDDNGAVSPRTRSALEEAIAAGIQVVIASGRAYKTLPEDLMDIAGICYAVTCNGAAVYDIATTKRVHGLTLPASAVEAVLELTKDDPIAYEAFLDGGAYTDWDYVDHPEKYAATQWTQQYTRRTRTIVDDMRSFLLENRDCIDGIELVVADPALKQDLWRRLKKDIAGVYITSSESTLIEISHELSGKRAGMEYVLSVLGLKREQAAAFGNADNDADMVEYAGLGVAVANASEACRRAAKLITGTNQEDGVAQGIEALLKDGLPQKAYTYIVKCADGSLYTGWTNDLNHRLQAHNTGKGAKYTKARLPVSLAYYEAFLSKEAAMRRECQIKKLPRKQKLKLIGP